MTAWLLAMTTLALASPHRAPFPLPRIIVLSLYPTLFLFLLPFYLFLVSCTHFSFLKLYKLMTISMALKAQLSVCLNVFISPIEDIKRNIIWSFYIDFFHSNTILPIVCDTISKHWQNHAGLVSGLLSFPLFPSLPLIE